MSQADPSATGFGLSKEDDVFVFGVWMNSARLEISGGLDTYVYRTWSGESYPRPGAMPTVLPTDDVQLVYGYRSIRGATMLSVRAARPPTDTTYDAAGILSCSITSECKEAITGNACTSPGASVGSWDPFATQTNRGHALVKKFPVNDSSTKVSFFIPQIGSPTDDVTQDQKLVIRCNALDSLATSHPFVHIRLQIKILLRFPRFRAVRGWPEIRAITGNSFDLSASGLDLYEMPTGTDPGVTDPDLIPSVPIASGITARLQYPDGMIVKVQTAMPMTDLDIVCNEDGWRGYPTLVTGNTTNRELFGSWLAASVTHSNTVPSALSIPAYEGSHGTVVTFVCRPQRPPSNSVVYDPATHGTSDPWVGPGDYFTFEVHFAAQEFQVCPRRRSPD